VVDSESSDEFLRALARAPDRALDPDRVAHFRILGRIGQGGMGVVYRAEDERLHRTIALKVLTATDGNAKEQRLRFMREARATAQLTHPNIAVVHEVGEDAGIVYIAMELVAGVTLRTLLRKGPLPIERAVPIGLQIALGLACAHQAKIVHRDLKPENVIVGSNDQVKIVDFGLAKQSVPADVDAFRTDEGRVLGTPAYMSPEQARGKEVTSATDIFAFGVMLHEMVAGRRPFPGDSLVDLMMAVERGRRASAKTITPAVNGLLDRCLASDPTKRLSDGGSLVEAIGSLSHARKRKRSLVLLLLALVMTLGAVVWMALSRRSNAEPPALSTVTTEAPSMITTMITASTVVFPPPPTSAPLVTAGTGVPLVHPSITLVRPSALPSTSGPTPKPRHDFDRQ